MGAAHWLNDLPADTPLSEAARQVLSVRLESVGRCLRRAVHDSGEAPSSIHKLRVAARRAGAALDIFARCVPAKVRTPLHKLFRKIRRSTSDLRDCDVCLVMLMTSLGRLPVLQSAGICFHVGYTWKERTQSQERWGKKSSEFAPLFDDLARRAIRAIEKPGHGFGTLDDLVPAALFHARDELARKVAHGIDDEKQLHRVRIAGKRLRYAMEIFVACFEPPFREQLYPALEEAQEILGRANDSQMARVRLMLLRDRFRALIPNEWDRFEPGVQALLDYHEQRSREQRQHYQEWWQRWQGSADSFTALRKREAPTAKSWLLNPFAAADSKPGKSFAKSVRRRRQWRGQSG